MTESAFSPEVSVKLGSAPAPMPPSILGEPLVTGREVRMTVLLPIEDAAGNPAVFSTLEVFVKETSMAGSTPEAERAAGTSVMTLNVTPAATSVDVVIPDLDYDTEYFFDAAVK